MRDSYIVFRKLTCLFLLLSASLTGFAQAPDQSQLVYSGGLSARNLNGYSVWQSFTAGITGVLTEIRIGFFNNISGQGTIKVFSGNGTGGSLLYSRSSEVVCGGGNCMVGFPVSLNVNSGSVYTYQFVPGTGMPDPYGIQVQIAGTYSGGQMGMSDPFGSYPLPFDMVFQTFVSNPLAAGLTDFEVVNRNGSALLMWTAEKADSHDEFKIEKSSDGINFKKIADMMVTETNDKNYHFVDVQLDEETTTFYRLVQLHADGSSQMSAVKKLTATIHSPEIQKKAAHVYRILSYEKTGSLLLVFNSSGAQIRKIRTGPGESETNLNLSSYPNGMYVIRMQNETRIFTAKLMND